MSRILAGIIAVALVGPAFASDMGTPDEAKAMSEKAKEAVNEMGREKAFATFADQNGGFREKDLYVFCVDMDGVLLSQPLKPELVGKNLFDCIRLGKYLFPTLFELRMMTPSYIDGKGLHHECELIEKRDQPPALA